MCIWKSLGSDSNDSEATQKHVNNSGTELF